MVLHLTEEVRECGQYDIIVAGGGFAGVAAAVAAARLGKRVMLVEKSQKLGGLGTLGLINFFVPMCNGRGKQIIFGMAEEFLQLSIRYGYGNAPEAFVNGRIPAEKLAEYETAGEKPPRYICRYSAELCALALTELCVNEGVTLMFDSVVSRPVMDEQNPQFIRGVVLENKSGREFYGAKMFVDVTGDADLLARCGVPTAVRGNFHTYISHGISLESCRKAVEAGKIQPAVCSFSGGRSTLYGTNHPKEIPLYDGTSSSEVNRYLVNNQLELLNNMKKTDRNTREILTLPGMAQFRTTRRIDGDYVLQESDVYRHFDDSVGAINDFDRRDFLYEIPYGTMICRGWDNVITAGRTAAGDGYAWDVLRVIPPAIISGQAAGVACAQAIDSGRAIWDIDITALQAELARENVMIHFDDADIPAESDATVEHND